MTANILTAGHIKCLEWLIRKDYVIIGLLTSEALKGYKKELVPFKERLYVLKTVIRRFYGVKIVSQKSLDPSENIKKHKCTAIASRDKWEKVELKAIKKYNLKQINIRFKGYNLHSSDINRKAYE